MTSLSVAGSGEFKATLFLLTSKKPKTLYCPRECIKALRRKTKYSTELSLKIKTFAKE